MPNRKWNLGDIRPVDTRRREVRPKSKRPMQDVVVHATDDDVSIRQDTHERESTNRSRRHTRPPRGGMPKVFFFGIVVLVFLSIGFLATLFLQGTELTVYPKFNDVTVQAAFVAEQNPQSDTLGYELLTLEETGERTVTATGAEEVKEHAKGELKLYNAFSKDPQRLIKNTRFESKDGLIFRISDSVVIPGYTQNNTGEKVPGTITAKVFADTTGETYNVAPGRFTIPGLKGGPQFDAVYGESSAPMQGGFVGTKLIVEESQLEKTRETIHTELKEKLLERLRTERPANFVLYESATRIRFDSLSSVDAGENKATIREHAVLEAPLFAEDDFARYLAHNTVVGYGNEKVRIDNPQSLTFSYGTEASSTTTPNKVNFNLAGTARIVWKYDMEKLRQDVSGINKDELPNILLKYQPAIQRATTVMRPFWKQSFPDNPEKIKIVEILESPQE